MPLGATFLSFWKSFPIKRGVDEKSAAFARCKPAILASAMGKNSRGPQYLVDVLKVGVPVTMAYVEGFLHLGRCCFRAYARGKALELFRRTAAATAKALSVSLCRSQ